MNSTVSVKTLLTILLALGFVATSVLAVIYYQRATASELQAQELTANLNDVKGQLSKSQSQLSDANAYFETNDRSAFTGAGGKPTPIVPYLRARG